MDPRLVSLYRALAIPPPIQERLTTEGGVVSLEVLAFAVPGDLVALGVGTVRARALIDRATETLRKRRYPCRHCEASYASARELGKHHNRCHRDKVLRIPGVRCVACGMCGEYHTGPAGIGRHMKRHK